MTKKPNHLYLNGYKLFNDKNTILISSVLNGKYSENIDYNLGFIYGSQDFQIIYLKVS